MHVLIDESAEVCFNFHNAHSVLYQLSTAYARALREILHKGVVERLI